jgi:hypothetical protein
MACGMVRLFVTLTFIFAFISSASAQKPANVGRGKCFTGCHDHDGEKEWSEKKDGPPPNNHLNALKQMNVTKTADFAKAVGVADPYDPATSSCLKCHATIVKGEPTGVYCETCHGPASAYLDPHKDKGWYDRVKPGGLLGMVDVKAKPEAWAPLCMKCHVMDDARLIAAKHPSGDDFDLGAKIAAVMNGHWKSTYPDKARISALGKAEAGKLVAARRGGAPVPTPAAPAIAPPPTPTVQPPAGPSVPPAGPGRTSNPPSTLPPASQRQSSRPEAAPPPVTTAPPVKPAPQPQVPSPPPQTARAPDTMTGLPSAAPMPAGAAVPDMMADPGGTMSVSSMALPPSPAAAVAAVHGRLIAILDSLLRRGGRAPIRVTPPEKKTEYSGPDADLLRLQEEVLSLAIDALKTAPAAKPPDNR